MKIIASLEVTTAGGLLERLKIEAIPVEVRVVTQESGLEFDEVSVQDECYERACLVAETWEAERIAEKENRSKRHCPKCGSPHLSYAWLENATPSAKCKNCGHEFLI